MAMVKSPDDGKSRANDEPDYPADRPVKSVATIYHGRHATTTHRDVTAGNFHA
jgi:hypothetical protein